MKSIEQELAELRERVARLEARLEQSAGTAAANEPPVIAPVAAPVTAPMSVRATSAAPVMAVPQAPTPMVARKPISSTVWIAAVGAAIFLLGAIYGLTVSIQRGWISPAARVGIGLVVGAAFAVGAVRMLARNRGLGIALLAVGLGTWTFSLYYAVEGARLFPASIGLVGCALAVVGGGWLAAREKAEGALVVAAAVGLIAPLAFGVARGGMNGLLLYLVVLGGAQLAVPYLAGAGANWAFARLLSWVGPWFVALLGAYESRREVSLGTLGELVVLAGIGLGGAWLPRHREQPWAPGLGTALTMVGLTWVTWPVWRWNHFEREGFAVVLAAQALVALGLVRFARARVGDARHDVLLLLLASACGLLAVAVAFDWQQVSLVWGFGAVALAVLTNRRMETDEEGAAGMRIATALVTSAATGLWLVLALDQGKSAPIFLNNVFFGAVLATAAWVLMLGATGAARTVAFCGAQFVAVNAIAWEFARAIPPVTGAEASLPLGAVLATLTYAVAGAGQWLRGLSADDETVARGMRWAGYVWLAVAAGKLFGHDLAGRDLVFKAVAALGVGTIFIVAALWANRRRREGE